MKTVLRIVGSVLLTAGLTGMASADPAPLCIGLAETEITPPEGFPMAGYYHARQATGTRDPLKAKAIVFCGDGQRAALVACDLTGISADLTAEVRRVAGAQTAIPAAHIVLTATHSHTAPDYYRDLYEYLGESREDNARYAARLVGGIVDAIVRAEAALEPVAVSAGTVRQQTPISFNRRFVMTPATRRSGRRLHNGDVGRPAGPIAPAGARLRVGAAKDDRPLGVFTNFALHLDTVGGTLWSGDYPFYVEQSLRESLGPELISVFGNGCCGDINHADPTAKTVNKTEFIGQSLAKTVQAGLADLVRVEQPTLRVRTAQVALPLQPVTEDEVARAMPLVARARKGERVEFFELVRAYKALVLDQLRNRPSYAPDNQLVGLGLSRVWAGIGEHVPVEVQVIALGQDVAIVCLSGEVFVDLGLAIKRASPFRNTMLVELSNCVEMIYIAPRVAYAVGSYEVTNSLVQPGAGELLAETAVRLLREAAGGEYTPTGL